MYRNTFHKTILYILVCISSITLAGCYDAGESADAGGFLWLNLSKSETRVAIGGNGAGAFTEGDRVGLFIDNGTTTQYRELVYEGGEWLPRLRRQEFGMGRLTLSAHYPVVAGASDAAPEGYGFDVAQDQSGAGYAESDLLTAQTVIDEGRYMGQLTFGHAMHRLRIELSGDAASAEVAVRSRVNGVVDLLTGEAEVADGDFEWIVPSQNDDGTLEAVIFPQAAAPYRDGDGVLLRVTAAGKEYDFKAPQTLGDGSPLERFEAGKQITIRLSLKEAVVSEWANRKVWVYGITPPPDDAWRQVFPEFYTTYYLPWKKEYGWYDCNKLNPMGVAGGVPDGNMCWAATVSNLLHWWCEHNRKYIEMYGDRYKGPDYNYPLPKAQESDIFQCFIDSFWNEGGSGDAGINWFIHGDIPTGPPRDYPYNDGGYFKDVFPDGVRLGKVVRGMGKTRFNETIKDALANRKAIGASLGIATSSGHMETIWGAEFDENGDVAYIYMADNDDRDLFESDGIGCGRYQIVYSTYPEGGTYTGYLTGYIGSTKPVNIYGLTVIELGEEYWKAYFGL